MTAERALLRQKPEASAPVVRALERGARVTVVANRGRWFEVVTEKREEGFLPVETVERDPDREAREKRAKTILSFAPVYGVVAEETDVLLAPFPVAARAGRLRKGEVIAIYSVDHAYFAFRDDDGKVAFVRSADVDLVPRNPSQPSIVPERTRALKNLEVKNLRMPAEESEEEPPEEGEVGEPPAEAVVPVSDEILEPAVLMSKVTPVYPEPARRAGIEGTVVLEVAIDASGRVTDAEVLRGLPLGLSEAALEAVRRWQYRPARGPAGTVASRKSVRILFTLGR